MHQTACKFSEDMAKPDHSVTSDATSAETLASDEFKLQQMVVRCFFRNFVWLSVWLLGSIVFAFLAPPLDQPLSQFITTIEVLLLMLYTIVLIRFSVCSVCQRFRLSSTCFLSILCGCCIVVVQTACNAVTQ